MGRGPNKKRTQLLWMRTVRVGDVLQSASGMQRVVRQVSRFKDGDLRCLTFTIQACSWTRRPYTVMNFTDLRRLGYMPVGKKRMGSEFDWRLFNEIKHTDQRRMHCCDVRGVA